LKQIEQIVPNTFDANKHWYEKSLNATIHPTVSYFFNLTKEQIVKRYCHLNPSVGESDLLEILNYKPKYYFLSGADLLHVTTKEGKKQMIIIENNSCPSGQKSMPLLNEYDEKGGYGIFMDTTIKNIIKKKKIGTAVVIYDKNYMEASGYAHAFADLLNQEVKLIPYYDKNDKHLRFKDEYMEYLEGGEWIRIDIAFRYLTQKPWNRLPISSKTIIVNPIITCLAGGRNKLMASKAYDFYNTELAEKNLKILTPQTIWDVNKNEIPLWVTKMGGKAVVKVPYGNAGQGVYTITNQQELDDFMALDNFYDKFIVQSLIGNANWSSVTSESEFYHVGTMPDKKGNSYVLDFRIMINATAEGYKPLSLYSRRALSPLKDNLEEGVPSWDSLGTNLSFKTKEGEWGSDTTRLLLMERKAFNKLGISLDNLIEGYIQTVISSIAIDKMAIQLIGAKGKLKRTLMKSLNDDDQLLNEIMES
jgi:hypothetical protein